MKTRCRKLVIRMMSSERDNQFPSWKVFGPPCRGGPGAGGSLPCGSIARLRSVWRLKCRVCGCEQADIQRNRTWPTGAYPDLAARQVPVGIEETRQHETGRTRTWRTGPPRPGQTGRPEKTPSLYWGRKSVDSSRRWILGMGSDGHSGCSTEQTAF